MNVKCCPICGECMKKDCMDINETMWFWYCPDCDFSEEPEIIDRVFVVQANTTHHKEQYWMEMRECSTLEAACQVVDEWDHTGMTTEVCEGLIQQKHLRIIRIEHAVHWVHPENVRVGE